MIATSREIKKLAREEWPRRRVSEIMASDVNRIEINPDSDALSAQNRPEARAMFQRILIPLNFTDKNLRALEVGLELAQQNKSNVTLLHVIELIEHVPKDELQGFYEKLENAARERMNFPASMFLAKDLVVDSEIVYGRRAEEIAIFAAANQMDLIVLSSHKVGPQAAPQSYGTISHKVAILAQCPVLLVK